MAELQPNFRLKLTAECKTMLTNFRKVTVHEYVKIHNEYCRMKINEEKAKTTKRPKVNDEKLESKFEQINFESEMSRIVKELVKNLPPAVQAVLMKNHLNMPLGLKVDSAIKPRIGTMWNKVQLFPTILGTTGKRSGSAQKAPATGIGMRPSMM